MIRNRSVPVDSLLPHIVYRSVADALLWLTTVFGFVEHYRYGEAGGTISGAQLCLGNAWIMIHGIRAGSSTPRELGARTQMLSIFLDDVASHYDRTTSGGAKIVEELHETAYGELQYGVEDLDGHRWIFSQHVRDLSPSEWGATIKK